jgi:hypothetical protein
MSYAQTADATIWQRIYTVRSHDQDVIRRAQSFIALCMAFIGFTAMCLPLAFLGGAAFILPSLLLLGSVSLNYLAGIALSRRGYVDIAGFVVGINLSLFITLSTHIAFKSINNSVWFISVSLLIIGQAARPALIWAGLAINGLFLLSFLALPEQSEPTSTFGTLLAMTSLLLAITTATYINANRSRDLFIRQNQTMRELEAAKQHAEEARQ